MEDQMDVAPSAAATEAKVEAVAAAAAAAPVAAAPAASKSEYDQLVERQRYNRLKFLLDKTSLYSNFLSQKLEEQQRQQRERAAKAEAAAQASSSSSTSTEQQQQQQQQQASKRPLKDHTYKIADYVKGEDIAALKRAKVADESASGGETSHAEAAAASPQKLTSQETSERQPKLVTGGALRDYQLGGVEWLVSLYENGLNGILADEMGLGKTLQCISFLAYLRERGVHGPFLIVAPLSTVTNWVSEFKRFTPTIPALLYHGSIEERTKLREKRMVQNNSNAVDANFPIIVTSYEIVMNDRKHLQRYRWKYIIVDEGHRIKNLNCKLIRELKSYHSANRLLLTGTPLQNNLSELWSLLNFLLPDIFDDLESFQNWFDLSDVNTEGGDSKIIEAEEKGQIVTKLHHILKPFLLRRLKVDVEKTLPKKREYLVYAPLSKQQLEYYDAIVGRDLRSFLLQKEADIIAEADNLAATWTAEAQADEDADEFGAGGVPAVGLSTEAAPSSTGATPVSTVSTAPNSSTESSPKTSAAVAATSATTEEDTDLYSPTGRKLREKSRRNYKEPTLAQIHVNMSTETSASAKFIPEEERRVRNMSLQNMLMQLRKACNHPYLFNYPLKEDGFEYRIDEEVVATSGKMLLLDKLLSALLSRGHKTLIFSQMTKMLDILGDYLSHRGLHYCRIDGSINYADRAQQISDFNSKPDIKVFLLSTRSGGLGINLTSADTCIIYDSDWNPQMDLQAQDRVHRIGQTKPVIIYRLCTANTVESYILQKAAAKRKLEKLVIHKGKFKQNQTATSEPKLLLEDLAEILHSHDNLKISTADGVISDTDLEMILNRSDEAFESFDQQQSSAFKLFQEQRSETNDALADRMAS